MALAGPELRPRRHRANFARVDVCRLQLRRALLQVRQFARGPIQQGAPAAHTFHQLSQSFLDRFRPRPSRPTCGPLRQRRCSPFALQALRSERLQRIGVMMTRDCRGRTAAGPLTVCASGPARCWDGDEYEMSDGNVCPACGSVNECGMEKGASTCWCFAMPHVLPVSGTEQGGRCYCRACLTRIIGDRIASATALSAQQRSERRRL